MMYVASLLREPDERFAKLESQKIENALEWVDRSKTELVKTHLAEDSPKLSATQERAKLLAAMQSRHGPPVRVLVC